MSLGLQGPDVFSRFGLEIIKWAGFHTASDDARFARLFGALFELETETCAKTLAAFKCALRPEHRDFCFCAVQLLRHAALRTPRVDGELLDLLLARGAVRTKHSFFRVIKPFDKCVMRLQERLLKGVTPLLMACNAHELSMKAQALGGARDLALALDTTNSLCRQSLALLGQTFSLASSFRQEKILEAVGLRDGAPSPAAFPNFEDSALFGREYLAHLKAWLLRSGRPLRVRGSGAQTPPEVPYRAGGDGGEPHSPLGTGSQAGWRPWGRVGSPAQPPCSPPSLEEPPPAPSEERFSEARPEALFLKPRLPGKARALWEPSPRLGVQQAGGGTLSQLQGAGAGGAGPRRQQRADCCRGVEGRAQESPLPLQPPPAGPTPEPRTPSTGWSLAWSQAACRRGNGRGSRRILPTGRSPPSGGGASSQGSCGAGWAGGGGLQVGGDLARGVTASSLELQRVASRPGTEPRACVRACGEREGFRRPASPACPQVPAGARQPGVPLLRAEAGRGAAALPGPTPRGPGPRAGGCHVRRARHALRPGCARPQEATAPHAQAGAPPHPHPGAPQGRHPHADVPGPRCPAEAAPTGQIPRCSGLPGPRTPAHLPRPSPGG